MNEHQAPAFARRLVLFVLAPLLALVVPFLIATRLVGEPGLGLGAGTTASASSSATSRAGFHSTRAASGTPASVTTSSGTVARGTPARGTPTSDPLAPEAESCRLATLREQVAVTAASASLAQFQTHIDAMNLLVAGKISLSAAYTFWD